VNRPADPRITPWSARERDPADCADISRDDWGGQKSTTGAVTLGATRRGTFCQLRHSSGREPERFTTEITEITEKKTLLGCWLRVLGVLGG